MAQSRVFRCLQCLNIVSFSPLVWGSLFSCLCFLFDFNDLPGRPICIAPFLVLDRIFGTDWWTLHSSQATVCRPRRTEKGASLRVGGNMSKERDRKSELVLMSTDQIFEWDRNNSDRNFCNVVRYVNIPLVP